MIRMGATQQIEMAEYKKKLIELGRTSGVLRIGGDSTLKSKRQSPYFINVGDFNDGAAASAVLKAYSDFIFEKLGGKFDVLYDVPEKVIGISKGVSAKLYEDHGLNVKSFFTRKEEKTHGEATNLKKEDLARGMIVGYIPKEGERIVFIDDVITTGGAKYDEKAKLEKISNNPKIVALVILVDRQEVDKNGKSAIEEFTKKTAIPVYSIMKTTEIYQHLLGRVDQDQKQLARIADYLRVYGTDEAISFVGKKQNPKVISMERSVIPACDMTSIRDFAALVKQTAPISEIGAYKIGFELGLTYGLHRVVEVARKSMGVNLKPIIYDHQKAATDIPDTGKNFAGVMEASGRQPEEIEDLPPKEALKGIDAIILFPLAGPETQRAWIYRAYEQGLKVIVGGAMTHEAFLKSEGGYIDDEMVWMMYKLAARSGVTEFVVPATKPAIAQKAIEIVVAEGVQNPSILSPGIGFQGATINDLLKMFGSNIGIHGIVGRKITEAPNKEYGKAAQAEVDQLGVAKRE